MSSIPNAVSRGHVLFVDDEPAVLEGVRGALRREPLRVYTAGSGRAALEVLASQPVDVVVSDEEMPGMCGSELLVRVRAQFPDVVRLILTGRGSLESAVKSINEGAVFRYLTKPCAPEVLAETLRAAVEMRRLVREHAELLARVVPGRRATAV